jgi:hypothetical protein
MNQVDIIIQDSLASYGKAGSNFGSDVSSTVAENELNLPIFNRTLAMPNFAYYYQMDIQSMMFMQAYPCMEMCYEAYPVLNQLATSHNTEELNLNDKR